MRKIYRNTIIASICIAVLIIVVSVIWNVQKNLPNTIFVNSNDNANYEFGIPVSLNINKTTGKDKITLTGKNNIITGKVGSYTGKYKLFGILPVKNTKVNVIDKTYVYPVGLPIGLYLKTQGVMVIGSGCFENVKGEKINPAKDKIESGDYIIKFNKHIISNKAQLVYLIKENKNKPVVFTIKSNSGIKLVKLKPVKAKNGNYMFGIWVRDDSQGIGTMSFIYENKYFALGHGISDIDTGKLLSSKNGSIYNANIWGIKKGQNGEPGGLLGSIIYNNENYLGTIKSNNNCGINGEIQYNLVKKYKLKKMEMALGNNVHTGKAKIQLIWDNKATWYNIEILKVNRTNKEKNMIVKITDKNLLKKTNGIVQGMSGCPIEQDGKIIGAVTHVLVNDSTKGYGIFAENMFLAN